MCCDSTFDLHSNDLHPFCITLYGTGSRSCATCHSLHGTYGILYYFEVNGDRTGIKFDNSGSSRFDANQIIVYNEEIKFDNSGSSSQAGLTDLVADNAEEMSAIALGTNFGGITDIETGPDGFLYILTLERESNGEGKIYRITQL